MSYQKGFCVWLTGLSGSGKTTIAQELSTVFTFRGVKHDILDGDEIRQHLSKGLGFSREDRFENIRRVAWVASRIVRHGGAAIVSCISPYREMRKEAKAMIKPEGRFVEVHVWCSLKECERRDPKGLYKKARAGEIKNFTGIDDPYENPEWPNLLIDTEKIQASTAARLLDKMLINEQIVFAQRPRALYVGRWQPFHNGHNHIIQKKLQKGVPVAIGVRDTPPSEFDPYSAEDRIRMIEAVYQGEDVVVFSVPDVESVNIGRKVGYGVERYDAPADIEGISATAIREMLEAGNDNWKKCVPPRAVATIEEIHGRKR